MAEKNEHQSISIEELEKYTETVPGGRYEVNGKIVDANGEEVKSKASAKDDKK